jgi:hypothetical protein
MELMGCVVSGDDVAWTRRTTVNMHTEEPLSLAAAGGHRDFTISGIWNL